MNAGRSYSKALKQAKANAKLTDTNRYLWQYAGVFWVEADRPTAAFGSCPYTEVRPDGIRKFKQSRLPVKPKEGNEK